MSIPATRLRSRSYWLLVHSTHGSLHETAAGNTEKYVVSYHRKYKFEHLLRARETDVDDRNKDSYETILGDNK